MTHQEYFERRQAIAEGVRNGMTVEEVARRYKASVALVKVACWEAGMSIINGRRERPVSPIKILALLFDSKLSLRQIADRLGATFQRAHQIDQEALEAGIPGLPARHKNGRGPTRHVKTQKN